MARSTVRRAGLVVALASFAVAPATDAAAHPATSAPRAGGTLTVAVEQSFQYSDNFDPTGEYLSDAWGLMDNLLIRTLVGYPHAAGAPGNKVVADIATAVPKPTGGGKTYTFHIKPGVEFSPPVSRQVACGDFVNAMQRLANPKDGGQYASYYTVIEGWNAYAAGKAKSIAGITCLSPTTIRFDLTAPTGDFLKRMAMPATGPQPPEVTKCFEGQPGKYGNDVISTGGYMIQGIDQVDISSCAKLKPASGYDGLTHQFMVRNPNYEQSTDSTRKNYVDQVRVLVDPSLTDIYEKIEAGRIDVDPDSFIPSAVLKRYSTTPSLRPHLFENAANNLWYVTMNVTQPPFDDIHVRRAMNWIIDKAAVRQDYGGVVVARIANHIIPDPIFGGTLADYAPYSTLGAHGSVAKAKAAMKGSRYADSSGMCIAKECKGVVLVADARPNDPGIVNTIEQDAAKIGITFTVRTIDNAYPILGAVAQNVPIAERTGWASDYADAITFFNPLLDGRSIVPVGNTNYALVGVTPSQCREDKVVGDCSPYDAKTGLGVPNVDRQLDTCSKLVDQENDPARTICYENLDKYMMTDVVPWIPLLSLRADIITSPNVTHFQFDQFTQTPAYSMISVKT